MPRRVDSTDPDYDIFTLASGLLDTDITINLLLLMIVLVWESSQMHTKDTMNLGITKYICLERTLGAFLFDTGKN